MAADARGGSNTIILRSGTYTLTIAGANEDAGATGDLDITRNLTIKGSGSAQHHHRRQQPGSGDPGRAGQDHHLGRHHPARTGELGRRTPEQRRPGDALVRGGHREPGRRRRTAPTAPRAAVRTAATAVDGGNGGDGSAGLGGGIFNAAGSLSISNSTISANQAIGGDGGQGGSGGFGVGDNQAVGTGQSAIGGKGGKGGAGAAGRGGGIYNAAGRGSAPLRHHASRRISSWAARAARAELAGSAPAVPAVRDQLDSPGIAGTARVVTAEPGARAAAAEGGGLFNLGSVSLQGSTSTFSLNIATGGAGGKGGAGGNGTGSEGQHRHPGSKRGHRRRRSGRHRGPRRSGRQGRGGGVFNSGGGSFTSTAPIVVLANQANGGKGGRAGRRQRHRGDGRHGQ